VKATKDAVRRVAPKSLWRLAARLLAVWRWADVVRLRDVRLVRRLQEARHQVQHREQPYAVYVRPLRKRVLLREGTSDAQVLAETFIGLYHLPPPEVPEPRTILDLGSNIGLTVAHYAVLFPRARILGIELDPESADLARRNVADWSDRCEVITGAAWVRDEEVQFERILGEEFGSHVRERSDKSISVPGYGLTGLVERLGGEVDFLKMDIEGGEDEVLVHNTGWAEAVRSIKIEVHHGPTALEECRRHLVDLGFDVRSDERHWAGLVAVRPVSSRR
jgi:FkbM family methyltransferase